MSIFAYLFVSTVYYKESAYALSINLKIGKESC